MCFFTNVAAQRCKDVKEAEGIIERIERAGLPVDPQLCDFLLNLYRTMSESDKV